MNVKGEEKASNPDGFLHSTGCSHVFTLSGGDSHSGLELRAPADGSSVEDESIASGGATSVHVSSKIAVAEGQEARCRSREEQYD